MRLATRCEFRGDATIDLEKRLERIGALLDLPQVARFGLRWFLPASSKRAALARPVAKPISRKMWKRSHFPEATHLYSLSVWNGEDEVASTSVHAAVIEDESAIDTLVVHLPDTSWLLTHRVAWDEVLSLTESLANALGGMCVSMSTELVDTLTAARQPDAAFGAYAVFFGSSPTRQSPGETALTAIGLTPPCGVVAAHSWQDVLSPTPADYVDVIRAYKTYDSAQQGRTT